jgi:asparagine synthase (glutamine-hydrolysing)
MCGIAGIMTTDGTAPVTDILKKLTAALLHRGPDGEGRYELDDTALLQTRLAIIDLQTGDQPLFADLAPLRPPLALVANGEIYNYVELKQIITGVEFKTNSDCEPPLMLYHQYGIDFAQHLRGMYAIAIHDPGEGRLVLSRDPFGIKPLYYGLTEDGFVFSSEFQAFVHAGLAKPKVRPEACDELLQQQFTCGAETILDGIYRVLPGETLVVEKGVITDRLRLSALPPAGFHNISRETALADLDEVLEDSVRVHQRSDVPYGMFLSGGVDSSALLAMMSRLNEQPVHALSAGFSGTKVHDERNHARDVAKACRAEFTEVDFSEDDFWSLLPEITAAMDDPAADYATLPTYKLAARAKEIGLKVVLSGEGGDELFGGYGRYRKAMRYRLFGGRSIRQSGALDGMGLLKSNNQQWRTGIVAVENDLVEGLSKLQRAQATDCADWLPNNLLNKLDRCLMAHGVEGRVPFLDPKVADFAFQLNDNLKVRKGLGKWLLRAWLDRALPVADAFSSKRGFTVPVGEWIAHKAKNLGPMVVAQQGIIEACDTKEVLRLFRGLSRGDKKQGQAAWLLLYYALWHNHHVMGRSPRGGVFDSLAPI